ncbi:MAG: flavoprotein oxidoreductase [Desulfuromonas sp.]|uniref:FAD-dependent oxidoreductase n=1 Tax=Desulfuromonas sp. TaxID=892 RepID=UPI000CC3B146|nr:FAD-dependent oxidoreductase [Desulfuromonas sp.]PLX82380.1 MAG: flavoprotein oxidoreductase [Desulfuromonas sp.]
MSKERLVVIGGDAAGMSAAAKAKRDNPELDILVFERSPHTSYSACGMPYYIGGLVPEVEKLIARTPDDFRKKYGIEAKVRHEVTEIDPKDRLVRVRDRDARREWQEPYDQLLIATGAVPFCPRLPGSSTGGIFGLSTLQSGIRVQRYLEERQPRKAIVVGGGYIGLEMAEALLRRGLEVALVQRSEQVMGTLDPDMGALVSEALRQTGVTLHLEESLTAFEASGDRVTAVVTDKQTLPADIVILGMGARPNAELAERAGIPLGERGSIRVNSRMQTPVDGVWAAGDCAETIHLVSRKPFWVSLGTVANKMGVVAGTNLGGGSAVFPGVVGTAVSKICKYEVARTGLQEEEIRRLGLEFASATIKSRTRAGYYPKAGRITVKILMEKGSGRLLGGQIVGIEGAAKRIDILATALHAGMTAAQLIDLDLSYAPPYSPVWDPVQTAARQVVKMI